MEEKGVSLQISLANQCGTELSMVISSMGVDFLLDFSLSFQFIVPYCEEVKAGTSNSILHYIYTEDQKENGFIHDHSLACIQLSFSTLTRFRTLALGMVVLARVESSYISYLNN